MDAENGTVFIGSNSTLTEEWIQGTNTTDRTLFNGTVFNSTLTEELGDGQRIRGTDTEDHTGYYYAILINIIRTVANLLMSKFLTRFRVRFLFCLR